MKKKIVKRSPAPPNTGGSLQPESSWKTGEPTPKDMPERDQVHERSVFDAIVVQSYPDRESKDTRESLMQSFKSYTVQRSFVKLTPVPMPAVVLCSRDEVAAQLHPQARMLAAA